jgi:hypothetical protein
MRSFSSATQRSRCTLRGNGRTQPVAYFSGLCSLIIFLFLSRIPAHAEWVAAEKDYLLPGLQTVYIDPDSIRREGNLVTIWQLIDFKWMQGNPRSPTRFLSTKTQKQFDCADQRVRLLTFTEFSRRMGTGIRNDGYVDKDNWLPVEPESINHTLREVVCSKE